MLRPRILGDRFVRGGQPFTLWGFNYWHSASPGSDPIGGDWSVLCDYHAPTVEREVAAMAALWDVILAGVRQCKYAGALGCNYCDTGNPDPARNVWARMGITTQDGRPKPAHEVFRRHAGDARPSADFHPEAVPYDPRAYRNSVQAIGEIFINERQKN